jgi:uncharacterized repeat protein (TIGR01451 family)
LLRIVFLAENTEPGQTVTYTLTVTNVGTGSPSSARPSPGEFEW